jgi:hypothetical protein
MPCALKTFVCVLKTNVFKLKTNVFKLKTNVFKLKTNVFKLKMNLFIRRGVMNAVIKERKGKGKEIFFTRAGAGVCLFLLVGFGLSAQTGQLNVLKPPIADRDLVIMTAEVTGNALFFPVDLGGVRLEVLAVRAPDGTIRTAFNTCQVCYASGRGYYRQEGTVLVCQNCGNRYRMGQVEVRAGGCNPVPIFPRNKQVTDSAITIPLAYLTDMKVMFSRWRRS